MQALYIAHIVGIALWALGLLVASHLIWRGRPRPGLYPRLIAPAAFVALLTGMWLLHKDQPLLVMGHMHAKAVGLGALLAIDFGCQYAARTPIKRAGLLHGAAIAAVAFVTAVSFLRPEAA